MARAPGSGSRSRNPACYLRKSTVSRKQRLTLCTSAIVPDPSAPSGGSSVTLSSSTPEPDTTAKGKLAKHLRRIRQSAGFATMPPLARRLGVSPDLISKIETGKHVPTMDIFLAWLEACEVTEEARRYLTEIWALAR